MIRLPPGSTRTDTLFPYTGSSDLVMAATLANAVVKQVILRLLERGLDTAALAVTSGQLDPIVRRLSNIVPAIVIWRGIKLVPHLPAGVIDVTQNVVSAFIALTIVLAISAGLNLVNNLYQRRPDAASRPIKRSEEHTSELQSLMRISYAVFCLKKKQQTPKNTHTK